LLNGKCGNSSVKQAVLEAKGRPIQEVHRATDSWSLHRIAHSDFRKIAVVRNPYARAVSIWTGKVQKNKGGLMRKGGFSTDMSFVEFLRALQRMDDYADLHVRAQWKSMYWGRRFLPDMVIKLEEPSGWDRVRETVPGLPPLPRRNVSSKLDFREPCVGEARELVLRRYARDFEVFEYET
jgi:hypothetical protein